MSESFDREKIVDCMFDPITSEILAELEDGKKECSILSDQFSMSESDLLKRLDYLIECNFLFKTFENDKCFLSANAEKLGSRGNFVPVLPSRVCVRITIHERFSAMSDAPNCREMYRHLVFRYSFAVKQNFVYLRSVASSNR